MSALPQGINPFSPENRPNVDRVKRLRDLLIRSSVGFVPLALFDRLLEHERALRELALTRRPTLDDRKRFDQAIGTVRSIAVCARLGSTASAAQYSADVRNEADIRDEEEIDMLPLSATIFSSDRRWLLLTQGDVDALGDYGANPANLSRTPVNLLQDTQELVALAIDGLALMQRAIFSDRPNRDALIEPEQYLCVRVAKDELPWERIAQDHEALGDQLMTHLYGQRMLETMRDLNPRKVDSFVKCVVNFARIQRGDAVPGPRQMRFKFESHLDAIVEDSKPFIEAAALESRRRAQTAKEFEALMLANDIDSGFGR